MKKCTIWGDLSSEKSSENYPEVSVCDECIDDLDGEEDGIVSVNEECDDDSEICHYCGKIKEEE